MPDKRNSAGDSLMKGKNLKTGTRKLKAMKTRQLNKLATCIAGSEIKSQQEMEEIKAILERFQGLIQWQLLAFLLHQSLNN